MTIKATCWYKTGQLKVENLVCLQIGITAGTPSEFISQARGILTQQNELESVAHTLQMEIEQLEMKNQELVSIVS